MQNIYKKVERVKEVKSSEQNKLDSLNYFNNYSISDMEYYTAGLFDARGVTDFRKRKNSNHRGQIDVVIRLSEEEENLLKVLSQK